MALNGDPDRRPVRITVPQTWYHAAVEAAVGALVAHHQRLQTGEAQFVDVSVQAAVFWTGLQAMIAHAIDGKDIERAGTMLQLSTLVTPLVYPCADGEVCLVATGETIRGMLPWMVEAGAVTQEWVDAEDWDSYDVRMLTGGELVHSPEAMRAAVTTFTRLFTKAELFDGGIARGVTLAPVNTVADVLSLEQLDARAYWDDVKLPSGRVVRAPGAFVKPAATPIAWPRPAPAAGEHTAEVLDAPAPDPGGDHAGRRTPAPGGREGRRLLVDRRRADHGQGARRPRRHGRPRRDRQAGRPAAPRRSVQGRHPRRQPLPVLRLVQHVQAVVAAATEAPDRPRPRAPPAGLVRHRPRLLHRRDDGRPRPRVRRRPRAEPEHHHGHDVPDGPGRAGVPARRLRLPRRGGQRVLRDHRLAGPPAGGAVQRLHRHRRPAVPHHRAARRPRPPPAHRRGPVHRPGADGVGAALPRPGAARRPGVGAQRPARRQPRSGARAARRLPVHRPRRVVRDRRRDGRAVAGAPDRDRLAGLGDGPGAGDGRGPDRPPRRDRRRPRRVHRRPRVAGR